MEENRLSSVIQYLKESRKIYNDSDFASSIGKGASYISEVKSGKRPITEKLSLQISKEFPEINPTWLLRGEGNMIRNTSPIVPTDSLEYIRDLENTIIHSLQTEIKALTVLIREKEQLIRMFLDRRK